MKSVNLFYAIGVAMLVLVLVLNGFELLSIERILMFEFFSLSFLLFGVIHSFDKAEKEMEHLKQVSMAKLNYLEGIMTQLQSISALQTEERMVMVRFEAEVQMLLDEMKDTREKTLDDFKGELEKLEVLMKEISVKSPN